MSPKKVAFAIGFFKEFRRLENNNMGLGSLSFLKMG